MTHLYHILELLNEVLYCGIISTIYYFEFPPQLSANHHRLFSKLTKFITWWKSIDEKIQQYAYIQAAVKVVVWNSNVHIRCVSKIKELWKQPVQHWKVPSKYYYKCKNDYFSFIWLVLRVSSEKNNFWKIPTFDMDVYFWSDFRIIQVYSFALRLVMIKISICHQY